jgi:hypothetical protein
LMCRVSGRLTPGLATILCICFGIRVNRPDAGDLSGPVGHVEQGGGRDGQVDLAGEPGRDHAAGLPDSAVRAGVARAAGPVPVRMPRAGVTVWPGAGGAVRAGRVAVGGAGVAAEEDVEVGAGTQFVFSELAFCGWAVRFWQMACRRGRWAGAGRSSGQRRQECSWMQGVS